MFVQFNNRIKGKKLKGTYDGKGRLGWGLKKRYALASKWHMLEWTDPECKAWLKRIGHLPFNPWKGAGRGFFTDNLLSGDKKRISERRKFDEQQDAWVNTLEKAFRTHRTSQNHSIIDIQPFEPGDPERLKN